MSTAVNFWAAELPQMPFGDILPTDEVHRLFADMRAASPVVRGPFGPMITRHEDVTELMRDKRLRGPGMDFARMAGIVEGSRVWKRQEQILLFMEGDDHHRLRRLVSKAFTPRAVEELREFTRSTIRGLIDAVDVQGACDATVALCDPYPIPVISKLVGIELDRWEDMSRWASSILKSLNFDARPYLDEMEQAQAELDEYLDTLIAARRRDPQDDLLSNLIAVEEEGDRLTPAELMSVVAMMLVAGTDTTRNQLSCMIKTFCDHPDQWALLRERPELVPNAVEEAIRWEPATAAMPRFTTEDVEVGEVVIPANTLTVLMSMSANHDLAALPDGDRFDITRTAPNGWHLLTFGGGIHYCLGANLARLELVEALAEMVERFPTLRASAPAVPHPPGNPIFGYSSVPIEWR